MIRRHFQSSKAKGQAALAEVLHNVELSPAAKARPRKFHKELEEKLENAEQLDLIELWENCYGSVHGTVYDRQSWEQTKTLVEAAQFKERLGIPLSEAEILSGAFQRLTAAKLFTTMQATYELTPAVHEQLFGTFEDPHQKYEHVVPSEAPEVEFTKEGEDYPTKPLSDKWCSTKANKFGAIIAITRETIITDKLGQVQDQARALAQSSKYREDQLAALAFRDTANSSIILDPSEQDAGCYYPENTQVALYRTSAGSTKVGYEDAVNRSSSNYLLHWDALSIALRLLEDMTNRNSQYVNVAADGQYKIVVPTGNMHRAMLLHAGGMGGGLVDISSNKTAGTETNITRVPDFLKSMGVKGITIIPWKLLPTAGTASQSIWYLCGDSKKQFRKHQVWGSEFQQATAAQLGGDDFKKDVVFKVRGGFNSGFRAVDDKYVIKNG